MASSVGAGWIAREIAALRAERPRVHGALRWCWRRPAFVLIPASIGIAGWLGSGEPAGDASVFRSAARVLLGAHGLDAFADPTVQIGPVYLTLVGTLVAIADALRLPVLFFVAGAQAALLTWLTVHVAGRFARYGGRSVPAAQWALGLVLVLGGVLAEATLSGHPEEVTIGLLLALGVLRAREGRPASAGLIIGLASGLKLWAVLAAPGLVAGRHRRQVLATAVTCCAVLAACYLPFGLFGDFHTFDYQWTPSADSTWALVGPELLRAGWWVRVLQGAVAGLAGGWVAARRRAPVVAVVLAVIATRLLLDPLRLPYYGGPIILLVALHQWAEPTRLHLRWRVLWCGGVPVVAGAPYVMPPVAVALLSTVALVAVLGWAFRSGAKDIHPSSTSGQVQQLVTDTTNI